MKDALLRILVVRPPLHWFFLIPAVGEGLSRLARGEPVLDGLYPLWASLFVIYFVARERDARRSRRASR